MNHHCYKCHTAVKVNSGSFIVLRGKELVETTKGRLYENAHPIEALRSLLRRIFDPLEEQTISLCSLTPQQTAGNGSLADSTGHFEKL
jgi:hypothetical protein